MLLPLSIQTRHISAIPFLTYKNNLSWKLILFIGYFSLGENNTIESQYYEHVALNRGGFLGKVPGKLSLEGEKSAFFLWNFNWKSSSDLA